MTEIKKLAKSNSLPENREKVLSGMRDAKVLILADGMTRATACDRIIPAIAKIV